MGMVDLRVSNPDEVLAFYADGIGLEPIGAEGSKITLGLGDGVPVVTLTHAPELRPPSRSEAGLFHTAILFPDSVQLARAVYSLFRRYPHLYQGASDHLVSRAFYWGDPEGNGVELYVDRPRSEWSWEGSRVSMATLPLDVRAFLTQYLPAEDYGSGDTPSGMEGSVGHVHLQVGDVASAREFYVDALGFDETARYGSQALFVSAGGYHHHMAMNTWNSRGAGPRPATLGLGRVDVLLPSAGERERAAARLRERAIPFDDDGASLLVRDPWENLIRLSVDD
ncbi:MAG TPA: VOC family protein [Actinomycetales bacterium]|nr:VOC family protein [Actinomycetales bacterium]